MLNSIEIQQNMQKSSATKSKLFVITLKLNGSSEVLWWRLMELTHPRKTWWGCVKKDMKRSGLFCTGYEPIEKENQGGNWLSQTYMEYGH